VGNQAAKAVEFPAMPSPNLGFTFLSAYTPHFLCLPCLALRMSVEESVVYQHVKEATIQTRTEGDPCAGCGRGGFVVRVKPNWRPI